tara:strand:+ start:56 stop:259 length:204 start_codon:yes stop_codon:yes gene_type:complete
MRGPNYPGSLGVIKIKLFHKQNNLNYHFKKKDGNRKNLFENPEIQTRSRINHSLRKKSKQMPIWSKI